VLKPPEFYASLRHVGDDVLIFAQALILRPEMVSIDTGSRIDDFTRIEGGQGVEIGRHVHVSSFCSIFAGGACTLGDYSCLAEGARILTGSEQLDAAMSSVAPGDWRHVETAVSVVDHLAFLGTNSVVLPGLTVGVGGVLAAGAVLTRPLPPWEVWAGNPARPLKRRDPEPLRRRGVPVDELVSRALAS
jgi:acetyltransferase-like isoleucine patch superfamily enzyme